MAEGGIKGKGLVSPAFTEIQVRAKRIIQYIIGPVTYRTLVIIDLKIDGSSEFHGRVGRPILIMSPSYREGF